MEALTISEVPTVETLTRIISSAAPELAKFISRAESPKVQMPVAAEASELIAMGTERRGRVIVATIEYTWESAYWGRSVRNGASVIQFSEGGRTGGEGWAETTQYIVRQPLTGDQATALASLISAGIVPELVAHREL